MCQPYIESATALSDMPGLLVAVRSWIEGFKCINYVLLESAIFM